MKLSPKVRAMNLARYYRITADPVRFAEYKKKCKESKRKRMQDPEYRAKMWAYQRDYRKRRRETDPEYAQKTKEWSLQGNRRKTKHRLEQLFAIYGNKCVCCGEGNLQFLTLDHINNDGNLDRANHKNDRTHRTQMNAILHPDRSRYQILCFNCNLGKVRNKGVCPHKIGDEK